MKYTLVLKYNFVTGQTKTINQVNLLHVRTVSIKILETVKVCRRHM